MGPTLTRRDLLRLAGGSALGIIFSPLPWKMLDDSAIWTQNWAMTPQLPHAPISLAYSTCTLCPGACGITARCSGGAPFGIAGTPAHPVSRGMLCPSGLAGHQMAMHPLRIVQPCATSGRTAGAVISPVEREKAIAAIGALVASQGLPGAVAVYDRRPGRAISGVYRNFLSTVPGGLYLVSPPAEDATVKTLQEMAGAPDWTGGYDIEHARTILSFGAPLLEGWGSPGPVMDAWTHRSRTGFRLIQAETRPSRTAQLANAWLQLRPGTEAVLALGLGNVIVREKLYAPDIRTATRDFDEYARLVAHFEPDVVSGLCGIGRETIEEIARAISGGPSLIFAGSDPAGGPLPQDARTAIAGLNVLVGSTGAQGGIALRKPDPGQAGPTPPPAMSIDRVPDQSIRLLIIDGAESGYDVPVSLIRRKVNPRGTIVSLSPLLTPMTAWADFIIPSPAHLEMLEEVPAPPGAISASFALSRPLHATREGATDPLEFLRMLSASIGSGVAAIPTRDAMLRERADAIRATGRGKIFMPQDRSWTAVTDFTSSDQFWQKLSDGGCWIDEGPAQPRGVRFSLVPGEASAARLLASLSGASTPPPGPVTVMPFGLRGATASAQISPLLSKIFQESNLQSLDGTAFVHPDTAASYGLNGGDAAMLRNEAGSMRITIRCDSAVLPGVVHVAAGPRRNNADAPGSIGAEGILALCVPGTDGTWRTTTATIGKA